MRQPIALAMPGRILVVVALFIASMMWTAVPGSMAETQSTPVPESDSAPVVTRISLFDVPLEDPEAQPYVMYMTRVDLPPGSSIDVFEEQEHTSISFTVTVTAGSICYTTEVTPQETLATAIFASPDDANTTHPGCVDAKTDLDCDIDDEGRYACPLSDGDTVYLPVNSAVEHEGEAFHEYWNPDTEDSAQVVLAGIEVGDGAGCQGGCP